MKLFMFVAISILSTSVFAQSNSTIKVDYCKKLAQSVAEGIVKTAFPAQKVATSKTKVVLLDSIGNDQDFSRENIYDVNVGNDAKGIVYKIQVIQDGKSCEFVNANRGFGNG
jgi:hypothetical protein